MRSLGVDMVVAHMSLLELANIKASVDEIRCYHGNVEKLPHSWGTYDAVFFGHAPAMAFSASSLFRSTNPSVSLVKEINYEDIGDFPLYTSAKVVYGFGRGSKQMGIPIELANLNPKELGNDIRDLPNGVYFGWVQVRGEGLDAGIHKMVMNIGNRPTFGDDDSITVEVHNLYEYEFDFYGQYAAIVVLGFIRPEMKFDSLDALVTRVGEDIKITRSYLEEEVLKSYQTDRFFRT